MPHTKLALCHYLRSWFKEQLLRRLTLIDVVAEPGSGRLRVIDLGRLTNV
jgi:hypothetical protein